MALKGLKVIEIAGLAPVPFCGMLFSDFGATVIRVDKTNGLQTDKLARGKQSIAVNMKHPEGRNIIRNLAAKADVLLDPFRPGVMERLKLGPEDLMTENPGLVYGRISGFGQNGPFSSVAGHDINYVSLSGVLSRLGKKDDQPQFPVNLLADFAGGGLTCAFGILMALFERQSSGKGQVVDTSMTEGAAYVGSFLFKSLELPIWGKPKGENILDGGAHFYNTYKTKDGKYMGVGALEPQFYQKFIQGMGLENVCDLDQQFNDFDKQKDIVAEKFLTKTQKEWSDIFDGTDACVTPILEMEEAPNHPQNKARQAFSKNPYTDSWEPEPAPKLSRTPGKAVLSRPDPEIGEHTVEILKDMGYKSEMISQYIDDGIVSATTGKSKL